MMQQKHMKHIEIDKKIEFGRKTFQTNLSMLESLTGIVQCANQRPKKEHPPRRGAPSARQPKPPVDLMEVVEAVVDTWWKKRMVALTHMRPCK